MRLEWDKTGERIIETGTDHVVLYKAADSIGGGAAGTDYLAGVAWNGCTGVNETPSGGEETKLWADNIKYLSIRSAEDYGATITAYTYPLEWEECDGSAAVAIGTGNDAIDGVLTIAQQPRKGFCLAFRTLVVNDTKGNDYGYKLHILYGCTTSPSEKANKTVNESPEGNEFSWTISTQPIEPDMTINGKVIKPTARIVLDVSKVAALPDIDQRKAAALAKIKTIEDNLYGTDGTDGVDGIVPHILTPKQINAILNPTTEG